MRIPAEPRIGAVISYSYLWTDEADLGRREGAEDRPAAIVMARADLGPAKVVYVLPVTHVPPGPRDKDRKVEVPAHVKRRLGLGDHRSWIIVDELNVFVWPGFDLRPVPNSDRRLANMESFRGASSTWSKLRCWRVLPRKRRAWSNEASSFVTPR